MITALFSVAGYSPSPSSDQRQRQMASFLQQNNSNNSMPNLFQGLNMNQGFTFKEFGHHNEDDEKREILMRKSISSMEISSMIRQHSDSSLLYNNGPGTNHNNSDNSKSIKINNHIHTTKGKGKDEGESSVYSPSKSKRKTPSKDRNSNNKRFKK